MIYDLNLERKCGLERPESFMGMDVAWPYKRRELGDQIVYHCPNNHLTWEESLEEQLVTCIWHRQSDTMMWWPQNVKQCNSQLPNIILIVNTTRPKVVIKPKKRWLDFIDNSTLLMS